MYLKHVQNIFNRVSKKTPFWQHVFCNKKIARIVAIIRVVQCSVAITRAAADAISAQAVFPILKGLIKFSNDEA